MSAEQKDNRTATQRLDDVERVVASLYNGLQQLANGLDSLAKATEEFPVVKQALRLMSKRVECIIGVAKAESGITPDSVDAAMVQSNVADLKEQVNEWIGGGALTTTDVVATKTFVVASEKTFEGTLANPRVQFSLESQSEGVQTALLGKKIGDTIAFGEGKLSLEILELYTINEPKPPVALAPAPADDTKGPEAAPAEAAAPAATETAPTTEAAAETPAPQSSNEEAPAATA